MTIKELSCYPSYIKKIEAWCKRCTATNPEEDTFIIMEGKERTGKTNGSVYTAGMAKEIMNRPINLFFRLREMINFAKRTKNQIIIWDEPALDSLNGDMLKKLNQDLRRLLMTCGMKRHFIIINIINFTRFDTYITSERPHGMVHLMKGRVGHGCYIPMRNLEKLRAIWIRKKKRAYLKLKSHWLDFPIVTPELFNSLDITINGKEHSTYEDYKRMKDEAIANIGEYEDTPKDNSLKMEIRKLKYLIATEPKGLMTSQARALHYNISVRNLQMWKSSYKPQNNDINIGFKGDISVFEAGDEAIINNKGTGETEKTLSIGEDDI